MTVGPTPSPFPAAKQPRVRPALLKNHRGRPRPLREAGRWLRILGPGLITRASASVLQCHQPKPLPEVVCHKVGTPHR